MCPLKVVLWCWMFTGTVINANADPTDLIASDFMHMAVYSLYYDSFLEIWFKESQYIALPTVSQNIAIYWIVTSASWYVSYRQILANSQP